MNPGGLAVRRGEIYRLLGDISVLLALAIVLGIFANLTRPSSARLPWVGDWKHHIEHRAFRAGVPVVFLPGVRVRLQDSATVVLDAREPRTMRRDTCRAPSVCRWARPRNAWETTPPS